MTQWEYHLWPDEAGWTGWCLNMDVLVSGPDEPQTYQKLVTEARKKFIQLQKESPGNGIEYKSTHSSACLQA